MKRCTSTIAVYLKSLFVCGLADGEDPKIKAIHPPIDSVLLDELYQRDVGGLRKRWQAARRARWSRLSSHQYVDVIAAVREALPEGAGLWRIEVYWRGHI